MNNIERPDLFLLVDNLNVEEIVKHPQWNNISNDFFLLYELLKKGDFIYVNKIPFKSLQSFTISLAVFNCPYLTEHDVKYIPQKHLNNPEFIIEVLNINYLYINIIPQEFWDKEDIVQWFCLKYSHLEPLQHLPEKYQEYYHLNKALIKSYPLNYRHISNKLKDSFELYNLAYNKNTVATLFPISGNNIKNNKEYALHAIERNTCLYKFVGESLRDNADFFLELIDLDFDCLEEASDIIRDNEHCVWESLKKFPTSLKFVSERLLNTPSFCIQLAQDEHVPKSDKFFKYWGENIRNEPQVIRELFKFLSTTNNLDFISNNLRNNKDFMLEFVVKDTRILKYVGNDLLCDSDFFIKAYQLIDQEQEGKGRFDLDSPQSTVFNYINEEAVNDEDFLLAIYKEFGNSFFTVIYPKIRKFQGYLIDMLNNTSQDIDSLERFMKKLRLKQRLEKGLGYHEGHRTHKI